MRKTVAVAGTTLLLALGPVTAASAIDPPSPTPYVAVAGTAQFSADEVCVGAAVTVAGNAFEPGKTVLISSDGERASSAGVDDQGSFSQSVKLPEGTHAITITGPSNGGTRTLRGTVSVTSCATGVEAIKVGSESSASGLPHTGANIDTALVAGAAFIIAGAALLAVPLRRRRKLSRAGGNP